MAVKFTLSVTRHFSEFEFKLLADLSPSRQSGISGLCCFDKIFEMKFITLSSIAILMCLQVIGQTTDKVVLIEQFTNSGCPPCASSTPPVYQFARTNPMSVAAIAYHASFPYLDSMHLENPTDANARIAFYGINGVPHSILDGSVYRASTATFIGQMQNQFLARKAVDPKFDIQVRTSLSNDDSLQIFVSVRLTDSTLLTDAIRLHIVATEEEVLKSSYAASPGANSLNAYSFVMRKMIPEAMGVSLNNLVANLDTNFYFAWKLAKIKSRSQLRVVAFVQNPATKEVYQAAFDRPIANYLNNIPSVQEIRIYPNPIVSGQLLTIQTSNSLGLKWDIRNLQGQMVASLDALHSDTNQQSLILPQLPSGIYLLTNQEYPIYQKIQILNQ
jgi:thiol-disulfide isomerase/thioredoxin